MQAHLRSFYFFPLRTLLSFLIFTCLFFAFGPISWPIKYGFLLFIFLLIVHLALYLGYLYGVKSYRIKVSKNKKMIDPVHLFNISAITYLVWAIPTIMNKWGISTLSPTILLQKVIIGFNTPQLGYASKVEQLTTHQRGFYSYANFLISAITFMAIPLALANWSRLSLFQRFISVLIVFIEIISWVGIGTNKGIVDLIVIFSFITVGGNSRYVFKNKKKLLIIATFLAFGGIAFFLNNVLSRVNIDSKASFTDLQVMFTGNQVVKANPDNFLIRSFSVPIKIAICSIEGYLTMGYYSLNFALGERFDWTYGFGNSWGSMSLWQLLTGQDLMPLTYLSKIDKHYGIDPAISWHSIYTWLASDLTFFGVPFFIFFVGKFLAESWLDSLHKNSAFAPVICSLFVLMVFYFFANNQVMSFSLTPLLFSFIMWRFTR
jgi:hypothetical protein